tara:strand:- start:152 stop:388 length:237 start_codon:yes stop_codon:yes gene_type:complete
MSLSKSKEPLNEDSMNGKPMNGKEIIPNNGQPMNELHFQSIMGEYLIDPHEYYENQGIRKAYLLNDEVMLRKILECEY